MRIGIDATAVSAGQGTGMQSYALNLTSNLLALDQGETYIVYCRGEVPRAFRGHDRNAEFRVCNLRRRKACEQLWLSRAARLDDLDVLHCICSLPLVPPPVPTVLTVHGLSWRITPEVFTPLLRWYWILTAERTMKKADRLIAITQWTKDVVHDRLGIPLEKIDVVHHGVDLGHFERRPPRERLREVKNRHGIRERFLLHVGSLLPVKNLPFLVRAFRELRNRDGCGDLQLVLAGGGGWGEAEVRNTVAELGMEGEVLLTGFVPSSELPLLYAAADLFVFPSRYEGFGLPILESFAAGTPVISSNASCLPEVGGDAALYFDPTDEDGFVDTAARVLGDTELRTRLVSRGRARIAQFSWQKTAVETMKAYRAAVPG